jgi:tetratricopeptide (TPR) repeat protein
MKAIESAQGLYDELYVTIVKHKGADTEDTYKICKEWNAHISYYYPAWDQPYIDDFSAARNHSMIEVGEHIDWIFILDSDDRVVDPIAARTAIITSEPDKVLMGRVQHAEKLNSFMQWRAWPRNAAFFVGRIHNQLEVYNEMEAKYVPQIHIKYFDRTFGNRFDRNLAILNDISAEDWKPEHAYYKGEMLFLEAKRTKNIPSHQFDDAKSFFEMALDEKVEDSLGYRCHYHLADYYAIMYTHDKGENYDDKAKEHIMAMLAISPFPREPFYLMGRVLASMGKHNYAVVYLQMAVDMPEHVTVWHMAKDIKAPAYEQLALSHLSLGNWKEALTYHGMARQLSKSFESTDSYFQGLMTK